MGIRIIDRPLRPFFRVREGEPNSTSIGVQTPLVFQARGQDNPTRTGSTAFMLSTSPSTSSAVPSPASGRVAILHILWTGAVDIINATLNGITLVPYIQARQGAVCGTAILAGELPDGSFNPNSISSENLTPIWIQFTGTPGSTLGSEFWIASGLSSAVPISKNSAITTTTSSQSIDLATSAGGIYCAGAIQDTTAGQSATWSGDQTPSEWKDTGSPAAWSNANLNGTNDDPANTVTVTWAAPSVTGAVMIGAAWR